MKKSFLVLSVALGATSLLSACGGSESADSTSSDETVLIAAQTSENDQQSENEQQADNNQDQQQGRNSDRNGSSQGIDGNVERRRDNELNRPGRDSLERNEEDGREVRSYDGTSNNEENPAWGATFAHLQRIAAANYTDGVASMAGGTQKSAREISNLIVAQAEGEDIPNNFNTSDYLWQWGQFIDHDIGLTDGSTPEQENIIVPTGDVFFDPNSTGTAIIPFHRAIYDPDTGTSTLNPREQENEISSWIDGSMVYGSDIQRNSVLRVGEDSPFLATSDNNLLPLNSQLLPNANGFLPNPSTLFLAGDVRVNEQAALTAMHTIWVREHNRLAAQILESDPQASTESVYEQARRLVIAKIQIITYNEYLPALLGENTMPDYDGYDDEINPTIYNEFSAAAYRLGHSEVSDNMLRIEADGSASPDGHLSLRTAFFAGVRLFTEENSIDSLLRGLAKQRHQAIDTQVVNGLRNFLFGNPGSGGFDLISLNIQRGRDHGLSSYNDTREAMGLEPVQRFSQISGNTNLQTDLFNAYNSVDEIDLWVGGLAEDPLEAQGSQLGELFTAINVKQFDELRAGDRFWYSRYLTDDELEMVRNTTLARVIRANTDIGDELQDNVFFVDQ